MDILIEGDLRWIKSQCNAWIDVLNEINKSPEITSRMDLGTEDLLRETIGHLTTCVQKAKTPDDVLVSSARNAVRRVINLVPDHEEFIAMTFFVEFSTQNPKDLIRMANLL